MIPVGKFFVGSHHQGAPRYPSNVTNWRLYHVFGGVNWSTLIKPTQAQGEHTNSTQKGPIQPGSQTLNLLQLQLHLGQDFYKGKWLWRKGILDPFHFQCITRHKPKGMSTVWLSSKLLQNVNIIRANLFCQLYVCMHMWELLDQISLKYEINKWCKYGQIQSSSTRVSIVWGFFKWKRKLGSKYHFKMSKHSFGLKFTVLTFFGNSLCTSDNPAFHFNKVIDWIWLTISLKCGFTV